MHWRVLRAATARRLALLRPRSYWNRQVADAKALWLDLAPTACPNASRIYEAAQPPPLRRILEFGANTGGNLTYFLDRHPHLEAIGVDINPIVKTPESQYPRYRGVVGDESALSEWEPNSFDLAFTVSVLDHIPDPRLVERILTTLVTLAPKLILLEPVIPGVHGDVSGRTREELGSGFPLPHKRFAAHSYVWDYDRWLGKLGVSWTRRPEPLHAGSLGPFYELVVITGRTDAISSSTAANRGR